MVKKVIGLILCLSLVCVISATEANANQEYPAVAFDGTNYLVVWQDQRNGNWDIYGARVDQAGMVLDPTGIPIPTATNNQQYPAIAFDGTNYIVVWQDLRSGSVDIYGARVNQAGIVLEPDGIAVSTAANWQLLPSVAFDSTNYLVIWQDQRSGNSDIYGTRVTPAGIVLDPSGIAISTATDDQGYPCTAFDGTNYFVAWDDERSGPCDIYGSRVNQAGTVLDTNGTVISVLADTQWRPSVVFGRDNYLVVWEDGRSYDDDIYGARVNQDGVVIDTNGILISVAVGLDETKGRLDLNSSLLSNFPNPFQRMTMIKYEMRKTGYVSLKIYDITGKLVRNLVEGKQALGSHTIIWNCTDDCDRKLPPSIYLSRLKTLEGATETKELIILR